MTARAEAFLLHYHEVALKGRNRPWFLQALVRHLRASTTGLGVHEVRPYKGRVEVVLAERAREADIVERLRCAFGVANFSRARRCEPTEPAMIQCVLGMLPDAAPESFRVAVKRSDKGFAIASPELERRVGAAIVAQRGWRVRLKRPALTVTVEIVPGAAYCELDKLPGPGGLPSGVSGRVLCLLSGGIDSPVAAWRMMRRGCRADFVHFHTVPLTTPASIDKVRAHVRTLAKYQLGARLWLVPVADVQRHVAVVARPALRTVVFRRFMARIAAAVAAREQASALVTGDALGQVASQTIENLLLVGAAANLPLLRPLIGMDKEEVVAAAQAIGTYAASIRPGEDACTILAPRHASTAAPREQVEAAERALDVGALVEGALEAASVELIEPEW